MVDQNRSGGHDSLVDSEPAVEAPEPTVGGRAQVALAVLLACQLLIGLDASVVNVALPEIRSGLGFSTAGLAWVFNAYTLTFGGLLLLGGRAGDVLGRRRIFLIGVVLFTAASLAGGLATAAWWLVAARTIQGVGGALASPGVLALIMSTFPEGPLRNRALGLFSATSSASLAIGLIVGGMLTAWASWRWVFFVNVPIGIAIVLFAPAVLPETERHRGRFDLPGALTGTLGVGALVYGFIRASAEGWSDSSTIIAFVAAVVLIPVFIVLEARERQPTMPLRLFANRNRAGAYVNMLLIPATIFDIVYFLTQYLQEGLHYSALKTGFAFLPMMAMIFVLARTVPRVIKAVGTKPPMLVGALLVTGAMLWLSRLTDGSGYLSGVLGPLLLAGAGVGFATVALAVTILSGVPAADSGAASGTMQTMQWIGGGSLGLAILVTVYGAASRHQAAHPLRGADAAAEARHVLIHSIADVFAAGSLFTLCAAVVALVVVRRTPEPAR